MPMLEFKCPECHLRFERIIRQSDVRSHECPSCGQDAPKQLSSFGFNFASGKTPGNTGVDSLDSNIDLVVGRDADRRWEAIKDRSAYKRQVQHDNGGIGKVPLAKNPYTGEYLPVPRDQLGHIQDLHHEYIEAYEEHKNRRRVEGQSKFRDDDPYVKYKRKRREPSSDSDNQ